MAFSSSALSASPPFLAFAELLLDRLQLLAQDELALALVHRLLGPLVDLARELEHFDPMREQLQHFVEPRLHVEGLQQGLLFGGLDVHEARDHVGQRTRRGEVLHGRDELLRRLRQQIENLRRPLLELQEARFDVLTGRGAVGDTLYARDQERIARQELRDAEALLSLRDQVVAAVLSGDVAQHLRHRTDLVEVSRTGVLIGSILLQEQADRPLALDCLLSSGDRVLASDGQRQDHARVEHEVAHRNDHERIVRKTRRRRPSRWTTRVGIPGEADFGP